MFLTYVKIHIFYSAFFLGDEEFSHVFQFSKNAEIKYNSLAYFMESNTKDVEVGKSKVLEHMQTVWRNKWTL